MEHHCHCEVQGVDGGRGGVGCAGGGCAFCFYDLGWLTGCGCHGGHGYPPLDGVDKKSGEVGGLPEARGLAHIASLRLVGITINIDWHGSRQKNTKEIISLGHTHKLLICIELCTSQMSTLISTPQQRRMKKQIPGVPKKRTF